MNTDETLYLDHAAGTFLLPPVIERLKALVDGSLANPSSIHTQGREAGAELDQSRRSIARNLGCKPAELVFTSGGTEANNLALLGLALSARARGNHIISCATEHPSILETLKQLASDGYDISYLPTDSAGQFELDALQAAIRPDTILISLMWVNNETGLIHPLAEIGDLARRQGILFHCDAVQALGHLGMELAALPVDSMSFSGHKIGAPAGIGVLFIRKGTTLKAQHLGGSQEHSQRGGTPNILGAVAFACALDYQTQHLTEHQEHYSGLRQQLIARLKAVPGVQLNDSGHAYADHILSCSFNNVDGEALFIRLDMLKFAVSNGSACTSGSQIPSHVLTALGFDKALAQATIRISTGLQTGSQTIDRFCDGLADIINSIRRES